jgi:hypothetical protein
MACIFVLLMLSCSSLGEGRGFRQRSAADVRMDMQAVHQELQEALRGALGHGHGIDHKQIAAANATLTPMFHSLPKNKHGRVEAAAMRYAVHRYFSKNHGWIIKGFESHSDISEVQEGGILSSKVPGYVEASLEDMFQKGGFSLSDILAVIIVLERLIFDEVARSVEAAFHLNHLQTESMIDHDSLLTVLESHLIVEMLERHDFDEAGHQEDRAEIHEYYPNWDSLQDFVRDIVGIETSAVLRSGAHNPFSQAGAKVFSFDDAVRIAQRISNEYGQWGNQECMELRSFLSEMDRGYTGRVTLGNFYHAAELDDRWGFRETPDYLRELGALDESSKALGPQVIISNYAYGMTNCLSSTPYYSVCCLNECEGLLQQIEMRLAKPSATPTEILEVMKNIKMTSFDVDAVPLSSDLHNKLEEIATKGHGKVSLHGRLFAQWLHFVFPNECPYPHARGTVRPHTQGERIAKGEAIFVEGEELAKHLQQREVQIKEVTSESELMEDDLWSWDEELMHTPDATKESGASHQHSAIRFPWVVFVVAGMLAAFHKLNAVVVAATKRRLSLPMSVKSHDL